MRRRRVRIGTRGSALSLRQTEPVAEAVRAVAHGLEVEVVVVQTAGDRAPDVPIERLEGTGFFAKELEAALLDDRCDLAVHSAKDLPTEIDPALWLAAFLPRADPRDALITATGDGLARLPVGARVGTSSVRRAAQLLHHRPDLRCLPIRGNIDTRLRKVEGGAYDAVCLAAAGLIRMGWETRIAEWFPPAVLLPAPGQGAIAVEARRADADLLDLLRAMDHRATRCAVEAERAFVARLGSGCRAPAAALAVLHDDTLILEALIASPDGRVLERCRSETSADAPARAGEEAAGILAARAGSLITAIRGGDPMAGLRPAAG